MADFSSDPPTQPFVPVAPEPEPPDADPVQAVAAVPVRPGTSRLGGGAARWVNLALALAIAIAIAGIGFAAGRMTAPVSALGAAGSRGFGGFGGTQLPAGQGNGAQGGDGTQGGAGFRGGFPGDDGGFRGILGAGGLSVQGTVQSISGNTLTLQLANGQTIQLSLNGTTTYHSETTASSSDVTTGGTVVVRLQLSRGSTSPTATDVTIVP